MKDSVNLPNEDVEFLDAYASTQIDSSRSAALHKAVRLLRTSELGPADADAWSEWSSQESSRCECTVDDEISRVRRD